MREVIAELKELRLHGMAGAWAELLEQRAEATLEGSCWLVEHLLQAEITDRAMRSVRHQLTAAEIPVHRDLAGFDFDISPVDRKLVMALADMSFTEHAHNARSGMSIIVSRRALGGSGASSLHPHCLPRTCA